MRKLKKIFKRNDRTSRSQLRRFTRSKVGTFFFFLFIFMAGTISVLPLIYSICTSLKPLDELLVFPPRFFVHNPTLQNYKVLPELLSNLKVPITRYMFNSLFTTIVGTFLNIIFSTMTAFVLSKSKLKCKKLLFIVVQFSLMFSAYTLEIPRYLIYNGMGIMDSYWMYILPSIPSATSVFLMKQYMDGYIPNELIESAEIDGASFWRTYWQIIIPMVKPAFLTIALFAFRDIWAMQPSGTIFSEELKTLPMIVNQITAGGIARSGSAMAVSVILMIPPIIVYFCTQSNVMETMNSAGIKG
jgi:ABC-type glycerol-3-phosphate transport system permease component